MVPDFSIFHDEKNRPQIVFCPTIGGSTVFFKRVVLARTVWSAGAAKLFPNATTSLPRRKLDPLYFRLDMFES